MAADGHLGMTALSRVTLASAGLSCLGTPVDHHELAQLRFRLTFGYKLIHKVAENFSARTATVMNYYYNYYYIECCDP